MNDVKKHLTTRHVLVCAAIIVAIVVAVVAGASSSLLLFILVCPLMMGAMTWRMMRGGAGRS